ncbi:MAG: hypothetical protein ACRDP3_21080 [Streptomyces sp.]|uniref:hypothetical protein n=1 Tax=Streptomyces sp. TaxID=1931 RepID=UPI003D6BF602
MSSRRDHSTHTTGAHRAHSGRRHKQHQRSGGVGVLGRTGAAAADAETAGRAGSAPAVSVPAVAPASAVPAPAALEERGMVRYEPYLDGLFTYCLSVMCEHDAAAAAVGETLVLAERQLDRDRAPAQRDLRRPWLYALARWVCRRRLAELGRRDGNRDGNRGRVPATAPHLSEPARAERRRELAALAWPEAAGTTPEQREALELAVRHGLPAPEVAAVLSLAPEAASTLLSHAACEVERTRAALAVVKSGGCPAVAGLAGDDQVLLGAALRRELVRHVDECPDCRRAAERAMAGVPWPGTSPAGTAVLAVLEAPRPAVEAAVLAVRRARCQYSPRFDRAGFPVEVKDRSARRERLRSRAVTTTVVATVIAAPVLALWAAYRGAPFTGESEGGAVSATEREEGSGLGGNPYENAAQDRKDGHGHGDSRNGEGRSGDKTDGEKGGNGRGAGAGRLTVDVRPVGGATLITLTASGSSPVRWALSGDAPWLVMSRTSGVLRPGGTATVRVSVARGREPSRPWSAHIRVAPSGALVTIRGTGSGSTPPSHGGGGNPGEPTKPPTHAPTTPPPDPTPSPSDPPSSSDPSSAPPS